MCSCGAGAILAFCRSIRPVCDIIIIWPDALIRTGELSHTEQVWYVCSAATLFYQLRLRVTVHCRGLCAPPPHPACLSICAGSEHAPVHTVPGCSLAGPVNHLPVTGGGNTTAGIGSPKVASGPLLSEVFGLLPLEMWICHIFSCGGGKVARRVILIYFFYFPLPRSTISDFTGNVNKIRSALSSVWLYVLVPIFS